MPLRIGSVVLTDDDMPEGIPFGGKLAGSEEVWSDGSRHLQITGVSLANIDLSGTLRHGTGGDSPLQRANQLSALRDAGAQIELIWMGSRSSRRWVGKLQEFVPTIVRNEEVDYTLSFFREMTGPLTQAIQEGTAQTTGERLQERQTAGTSGPIGNYRDAVARAQGRG